MVVAALAVRLAWLAWHGAGEITWDGAEYARTAGNLLAGHGLTGLRGSTNFVFPPLYSLLIAALMPVAQLASRAGVVVSLISGAMFVLPIFGITRTIYGQRAAFVAAGLAVVFPFAVELSTVVLADMLFLTLNAAGLHYLLRVTTRRRTFDAIACGAAFGLAYLTRPEGMLFEALAVAVVLAAAYFARSPLRNLAALALAVVLPFAILAAPYIAFLSAHAGHVRVEGKSLLNLDIGLRMARGMSYAAAADAIDDQLNEVGPELERDYYFDPHQRHIPSFGTVALFGLQNSARHVREILYVARSLACGSIAFALLAVFGFAAGRWTRRRTTGTAVLIAYGAVVALSLASVFHFWERYFVGFVPLIVVFAAYGVMVITDALRARIALPAVRFLPALATAAVLAACLFSTRTGFTDDSHSLAEMGAGRWLAQNGGQGARVLSISDQSVYYAHGVWSMLPYAPDQDAALRYVRKIDPAFIILNREYASERPYVDAWLANTIPDPRGRVIYRVVQDGRPAVEIIRWRTATSMNHRPSRLASAG